MIPPASQSDANWVVIQRNPLSGSGWRSSLVMDLVRALWRIGLRPRLFRDRRKLDAWVQDPLHRNQIRCLVAAGGDGTVADLVSRHPAIPIAILPVGTENLLARGLSIPASGSALAQIISSGATRRLDLCAIGERRFTLVASAGFDADVIRRVDALRTGHISHLAYFQPIYESLRNYQYPRIQVWCDDDQQPLIAKQVMIVNFPMYALRLPIAANARPDDGLFELRLFQKGSMFQILRYFCNLAIGRHGRLPDVICRSAHRVRLTADEPIPVQVDGDLAGTTPVELQILPGALEVVIPQAAIPRSTH